MTSVVDPRETIFSWSFVSRGGWKRCQKQTRGRRVRLGSDRLLEDTRRKTKKGLGEDGKEKGNGELIDTTCSWSTRTGRPD